eukprot:319642-Prymnesium_polylepis.2
MPIDVSRPAQVWVGSLEQGAAVARAVEDDEVLVARCALCVGVAVDDLIADHRSVGCYKRRGLCVVSGN